MQKKKKKWSLAFFPDHLFASLSEDNPFLGGRWGKFQVVENVNQKKLSVCVFPISSLFPLSIRGFYDLKKKKSFKPTHYTDNIFLVVFSKCWPFTGGCSPLGLYAVLDKRQ